MGKGTAIEYCDDTCNGQMGCNGCELWSPAAGVFTCYAGAITDFMRKGQKGYPEAFGKPVLFPERIRQACQWKDLLGTLRADKPWLNNLPRVIFLDDMGDTFTEDLDLYWLLPYTGEMEDSGHIWLFLTKRPGRMIKFFARLGYVPSNFWLGVSVVERSAFRARVEQMRAIRESFPDATLWVSWEPAYEAIDWTSQTMSVFNWFVFGGESEAVRSSSIDIPPARPSHLRWFLAAAELALDLGIPRFFKQWGAWVPASQLTTDQAARSSKSPSTVLRLDGSQGSYVDGGVSMVKVGKRLAGAKLAGVELREMPKLYGPGSHTPGKGPDMEPQLEETSAPPRQPLHGEEVIALALDRLRPSPYNPRIFPSRPSHELLDLARSIRRIGLIQPITVRPMKLGAPDPETGDVNSMAPILPGESWDLEEVAAFELVAGERRFRACSLRRGDKGVSREEADTLDAIGDAPSTIGAIIRQLTDQQAMEITAVENLDREDLSPLEEASGVATLMMLYSSDVEAVAARLSRPVSWVQLRTRLTKLTKRWRKAIADGKDGFHKWSAAHLVEITRLDPSAQDGLLEQFHSAAGMSVAQVRAIVANEARIIGTAPFDPEDAALVPACGSCAACPKTSASAPGLFEDLGDDIRPTELRRARCLDPRCWLAKAAAAASMNLKELTAEHPGTVVVFEDYGEQYRLPKDVQGSAIQFNPKYSHLPVELATAGERGAFPGVYMVGQKTGQVIWLKRRKQREFDSHIATGKTPGPTSLADRRAQLNRRRMKAAVESIAEQVGKAESIPGYEPLMALAAIFGTKNKRESLDYWIYGDDDSVKKDLWKEFERLRTGTDEGRNAALWQQIRPVLLSRLTYTGSGCDVDKLYADAKQLARLTMVDAKAALDAATESIKEPKSWSNLSEDGTPKEGGNGKAKGKAASSAATEPAKAGRAGAKARGKKVGAGKVAPAGKKAAAASRKVKKP